jgi:hypothetical protein
MKSLVLLILAAFQAGAALPRLGMVGQRLTDAQVAELKRIAATTGRNPWLLVGDEAFAPPPTSWFVDIYLAPEVTTDQLRRGQIQTAVSEGTASGADRKPWRLDGSALWAQVAVRGRAFEEIAGDRDINRPFRVSGGFADDEIVSLIAFIRSSPKHSSPPSASGLAAIARIFTDVEGSWPVCRIHRTGDETVQVVLLSSEHDGQTVSVSRVDGSWVVTGLTAWVSG